MKNEVAPSNTASETDIEAYLQEVREMSMSEEDISESASHEVDALKKSEDPNQMDLSERDTVEIIHSNLSRVFRADRGVDPERGFPLHDSERVDTLCNRIRREGRL